MGTTNYKVQTVTEWTTPVAWASTIQATTTAPTLGTATIIQDSMSWRRNGKNIQIKYFFKKTATGTATSGTGDYLFPLPAGIQFDTSIVPVEATAQGQGAGNKNSNVGIANCQSNNAVNAVGYCSPWDSTKFVACMTEGNTSGGGNTSVIGATASVGMGFAQNLIIQYSFEINAPVLGWTETN